MLGPHRRDSVGVLALDLDEIVAEPVGPPDLVDHRVGHLHEGVNGAPRPRVLEPQSEGAVRAIGSVLRSLEAGGVELLDLGWGQLDALPEGEVREGHGAGVPVPVHGAPHG